ncbi:MAG TPA: transglycosylase domain-containing protein [Nocardioides sp.]|uniref:transglycosylase domain-containing protein n=1 Tax=uncultured Nocardioides sp. TaxID=198441 RepID=UPI002607B442|nr:transglycosylase domain-containing protein [uncultured Nocardioides sp.]HRD63422.1 transglycosylase domain-containing protein [Nocardioides sp.]HRK46423.1 transglycosylase domain-containing protein [Nocardioides sp.]
MPRHERLPAYRVLSHLLVMVAVAVVLGIVVAGLAIPFAGMAGIGARNVARTMDNLPEELKTEDLSQRSTILDANGNLLASVYDENRITVPLKDISRTMVSALVAIEDYRFYQHGALDLKGTLRALITNQANDGVVQGGSSITQQLVKLTLQSQAKTKTERAAATADTYARKLKELRYAIALEQTHSKDWILERYLNTAYFGDGAYGVQAAAKHYFDVNARQLNLRQSALLAGLVKNPYGYDPTKFPDKALERRDVVIDRMAALNVIPTEKAEKTKEKDLSLKVQDVDNGCVNSAAPFFCDYVMAYLLQDPQLGRTVQQRRNLLKNGGLTIKTTLDMTAQTDADKAVSDHVGQTDQAIGALAIVEPGTGAVKALAQSRPMGNKKKLGETYVNFTIPKEYGGANGFQPGSTFKAFTLASAIEQGYPMTTQFDSPSPMTFDQADFTNCPGEGFFGGDYTANNSTGTGWYNMYSGTRNSINTYFLQLEQLTGVCKPYELAKQMGVRLTAPQAERYPSFTLGIADASPLEMAEAYATFAARGLHCDSRPVSQVLDAGGNVLLDYEPTCTQVMKQETADAVSDVLRGVIEGGFASAQRLTVAAAGKTGTTQEQKAVWFCGYTAHYAAAATIAGIDSQGRPDSLIGKVIDGNPIYEASGSGFAAPIWGDALKPLTAGQPYDDFTYPVGIEGVGVTSASPPKPPKGPRGNHGGGHGNGGRPGR